MRRPPPLADELVEEVLFRLPPDDPASLVSAALACRRFRRLVADPGFRRRYRRFHRTPPLLGFLRRVGGATSFAPATSSSFLPRGAERFLRDCLAIGARHGRVLLLLREPTIDIFPINDYVALAVWDPVSGDLRRLPTFQFIHRARNAVLLCTAPGCGGAGGDHLDCPRGGPFAVVRVSTEARRITTAYVFSSESGKWRQTARVNHDVDGVKVGHHPLVGDAIYFLLVKSNGILEYDLKEEKFSSISLPPVCRKESNVILAKMEDGGLGFGIMQGFNLCMWSRDSDSEGWTQRRVIELYRLLPTPARSARSTFPSMLPRLIAIADCGSFIFTWKWRIGFFAIDLKSGRVTKVPGERTGFVPYTSFCTPALRADPSDGAPIPNACDE
ncbi:hypothetical protein ACP4OV_012067 [Aristida adscensionis]